MTVYISLKSQLGHWKMIRQLPIGVALAQESVFCSSQEFNNRVLIAVHQSQAKKNKDGSSPNKKVSKTWVLYFFHQLIYIYIFCICDCSPGLMKRYPTVWHQDADQHMAPRAGPHFWRGFNQTWAVSKLPKNTVYICLQ